MSKAVKVHVLAEWPCKCGTVALYLTNAAVLAGGLIGEAEPPIMEVKCKACETADRKKETDEWKAENKRRRSQREWANKGPRLTGESQP